MGCMFHLRNSDQRSFLEAIADPSVQQHTKYCSLISGAGPEEANLKWYGYWAAKRGKIGSAHIAFHRSAIEKEQVGNP